MGVCARPGMSELEEGLLAGQLDEQDEKEKAESGMSLSVAQPLVREWLAKRRANLRPVGTFFNTANFQVPLSAGRLSKRLVKNVDYFQSNYVLVFLILVLYCPISSSLSSLGLGVQPILPPSKMRRGKLPSQVTR